MTPLTSPRFLSFLGAQFLGAANDNALKASLTQVILATIIGEASQLRLSNLATFLFPIPFLLFSPIAGYLADRFPKQRMLFWTKMPEIAAMAVALIGFGTRSIPLLMGALFLMAVQSAFFGPVKYGLLPESVPAEQLSMANGVLNMTTYVAILVGASLGLFVYRPFQDQPAVIGLCYLAIAAIGTVLAWFGPAAAPGNRGARFDWKFWNNYVRDWREARKMRVLFQTMLGIAFFGFLGSVFMTVVPIYGKNTLGLTGLASGFLLMFLSIGIAVGSLFAGKLSRGRVEIGLVPLGSIGMAIFGLDIALFGAAGPRLFTVPARAVVDLLMMGFFSGFFIVPLNSLLQQRSPDGMKGRLIAFSNVLTFGAVLLAAGWVALLTMLFGPDTQRVVLWVGVLTTGVTIYIVTLLPEFLVRLLLWILTTTIYRIRSEGEEHLPRGGGLLVANHVSWIDALLITAACDREVRFLMFRPYYEAKALNWFFRRMKMIPVAASDPPELKEESLVHARREIEDGHLVCIFAEGSITRTGNLLRFRRGFERIAEGLAQPIVPVLLDGVWGSIFSFERGRVLFKRPRRIPYPLRVVFGRPMPSSSRTHQVKRAIQELSAEALRSKKDQRPLAAAFERTARRFRRRPFLIDEAGSLTFGTAKRRVDGLAAWLAQRDDPRIGVLLPPGSSAAIATLGVLTAGKSVVPLDANLDDDGIRRQIEAAGLKRVLTDESGQSRHLGVETATVGEREGRAPELDVDLDAEAAVVFSASSHVEGPACGVVLTHHNILSNMESLKQVFRLSRDDRILGVLPPSTSFGLIGTILLPAVVGLSVVYSRDDNPAGAAARHRVGVVPIPAEDLDRFVEAFPAEAAGSIRHVIVAGPRLDAALVDRAQRKLGVAPLEGFGLAECAPLVSLNLPHGGDGDGQAARRSGTVGQPLPGVVLRIVGEGGDDLPPGEEGRLFIRGPNVTSGYVGRPELTAAVLEDGWLKTGYRGSVDPDGFLTLASSGVSG